jgi:hypothetical protein
MRQFLDQAGEKSECPHCHAEVYIIRHTNGDALWFNPDGGNHFRACPHILSDQHG